MGGWVGGEGDGGEEREEGRPRAGRLPDGPMGMVAQLVNYKDNAVPASASKHRAPPAGSLLGQTARKRGAKRKGSTWVAVSSTRCNRMARTSAQGARRSEVR